MIKHRNEGSGYLFSEMDPDHKETKAPPKPEIEEEKVNCQYCEDVGPCMYCDRGKMEAQQLKKHSK